MHIWETVWKIPPLPHGFEADDRKEKAIRESKSRLRRWSAAILRRNDEASSPLSPKHASTYKKKRHPKWRCYCHISPGRNDFHGFWQNPSFFVRAQTEGYLKSVELRPYSNAEAATKAERTMAHRLRKQGCGVWAGHHDRKS